MPTSSFFPGVSTCHTTGKGAEQLDDQFVRYSHLSSSAEAAYTGLGAAAAARVHGEAHAQSLHACEGRSITSPPPTWRPLLRPPDGPPDCTVMQRLLLGLLCQLQYRCMSGGPALLHAACVHRQHEGCTGSTRCLQLLAPFARQFGRRSRPSLQPWNMPASCGSWAPCAAWLIGMLHRH